MQLGGEPNQLRGDVVQLLPGEFADVRTIGASHYCIDHLDAILDLTFCGANGDERYEIRIGGTCTIDLADASAAIGLS